MLITPSDHRLTLTPRAHTPALQLNAEVRAIVRRDDAGQLLLELENGSLLSSRSQVPLRPGEQLQLRVIQMQPTIVLQIMVRQLQESAVDTALRALLSSSGSRTPLIQGFGSLLNALAEGDVPASVRQVLQAITAQIRNPAQLTDPQQLAATLRGSGLMLERSLLSQPGQSPVQDLKAQLLSLAARLRAAANTNSSTGTGEPLDQTLLARLSEASESMLARLETLQLQAASNRGWDLLFEIPLQAGVVPDKLQLRIQDERDNSDGDRGSTPAGLLVRLRFEFASGALGAVLRLSGTEISMHWWAEQTAMATRLHDALPQLIERLEALGLQVGEVGYSEGAPPSIDDLPVLQRRGLLDEKA